MKYNVVILGLGALGKRHLSSILESELMLDVYCYDINENAMDNFEWKDKYNNKKLIIVDTMNDLPAVVDFALFSMTADARRIMFDKLISLCKVKNILFEKVLFQCIDDYCYVGEKLKNLNINAWVNCSRRQMHCYQELKKDLSKATKMDITISGGEWGLACNLIHKLDLIEFLSDSSSTVIERMKLLPCVSDSKRRGFKEVYGVIEGHSGKCNSFSINNMKGVNVPEILVILSDIGQYIIFEGMQKMIFITKDNNYEYNEKDFIMPYQSQMTKFIMEDILLRGNSRLAGYDDSSRLHLEFIKPLTQFFKTQGMGDKLCPIT